VSVNRVRDGNAIKKDAEGILRYKGFKNRNTHYVACKKIVSNNRGSWIHLKIMHQYLSNIPGKHEDKELQKTAVLGTARILRKVLM
jgi:hypothetical protein